jgi:DNA polymerase/3'-5' exonuclease PolX
MSDHTSLIINALQILHDEEKSAKQTFKARAYLTVIDNINALQKPVTCMADLAGVKGIGEKIRAKIEEIFATGSLKRAVRVFNDPVSKAKRELATVWGIGPAKAAELVAMDILSVDELVLAASENPDLLTPNQKIGLKYYWDFAARIPREEMHKHSRVISDAVASVTHGKMSAVIVGSYRRGAAESGDIDVLLHPFEIVSLAQQTAYFNKIIEHLQSEKYIVANLAQGSKKFMGACALPEKRSRRLDMLLTNSTEFPMALLYFTGSQTFNIRCRTRALEIGYTLNEHSLTPLQEGAKINFLDEKSVLDFLGIGWVEPTAR